jgi:hypothetical protein
MKSVEVVLSLQLYRPMILWLLLPLQSLHKQLEDLHRAPCQRTKAWKYPLPLDY